MTAVFPFLVHALFAAGAQRPHKRLYDRLPQAVAELDADVAARRDKLLAAVSARPVEAG